MEEIFGRKRIGEKKYGVIMFEKEFNEGGKDKKNGVEGKLRKR